MFRDSESLGKSNGKKCYHIWTFLFENSQKSPRNFFFFADFALQNMMETALPDRLETSGRRAKKIGFLGILGPPGLETSGRRAYR